MTSGEKQEACGETFSENSPFFTGGGEEVRVSILREWTLRHIQGEGATSAFSDLREWEESGATTPSVQRLKSSMPFECDLALQNTPL